MLATRLIFTLSVVAPLAAGPARAQTTQVQSAPETMLPLSVGGGRVVTLTAAAANVFVADPKIAEVRPASPTTLFIFGIASGRTTIAALTADGRPIAQYAVLVSPSDFSAVQAQAAVARAVPGARVSIERNARGLAVSGEVASPEEAQRVLAVARGWTTETQTVEDRLAVRSATQVTLRVRIAEISRQVVRALGVNWQALGSVGKFSAAFTASNPLLGGLTNPGSNTLSLGSSDANALIDALAQDNLARIMAEPTLTVMSGQPASFLAGGEFPIPVGQQNSVVTIDFKHYGVKLDFVPTVLSSGRINLHVSPEVSQLSTQGAVQLSAGNSSLQIPGITTRRAETTLELGSGQSFALAGLLQDQETHASNGLPGLGDLPLIGAAFRADNYQRQETEVVIIVTPYIVRPVNDVAELHVPGDDRRPPSDLERILQLRQIGTAQPAVPVRLPGDAGFIVQ